VRLYLSSYRIGTDRDALRSLVGHGGRAALIFNALDVYGKGRLANFDREREDLAGIGFSGDELDLRRYFGKPDALRAALEAVDLVWVVGGNTFSLARAMTHAGFADAVAAPLAAGTLVYAGYSAGACIVGPDLDGCDLMDEPDATPLGYPAGFSTTIAAESLGWVPWRIVPHWDSPHDESPLADRAVTRLLNVGLPFRTLRDGRAIVVDGTSSTVV
jgi:dipeptidase E